MFSVSLSLVFSVSTRCSATGIQSVNSLASLHFSTKRPRDPPPPIPRRTSPSTSRPSPAAKPTAGRGTAAAASSTCPSRPTSSRITRRAATCRPAAWDTSNRRRRDAPGACRTRLHLAEVLLKHDTHTHASASNSRISGHVGEALQI